MTQPGTFQTSPRFFAAGADGTDAFGLGAGFGGCFAPETLMGNLLELESLWLEAQQDPSFQAELDALLHDYAGRATPLSHAPRLSERTGVDIWFKREDLLHTGAHKLNNTLGQCLLAKRAGKGRIIAETGAGQHGVASATTAARLGLECVVYMGAVDAERQAPNVQRMKLLGAEIELVHSGSKTLKDAVDEAMRAWVEDPLGSHYVLGSALGPHPFPRIVADFQSVIGREAREQILRQKGALPDKVVACVGGGSNAIGIFRGFVDDDSVGLVGVEAGGHGVPSGQHAARFSGGAPGVLHGAHTWMLQDGGGQVRETHSVSAGLDYPAVGPEHAALYVGARARYESATDDAALDAFAAVAELEGILPALESSHAVAWVMENSQELKGQCVLINMSGRGDKDLENVIRAGSARAAKGGKS